MCSNFSHPISLSLPQTDNSETISAKSEALSWSDGLMLVYSITDRDSFNFIKKLKQELQNSETPVMLLIGEHDWLASANWRDIHTHTQ